MEKQYADRDAVKRHHMLNTLRDATMLREAMSEADDLFMARFSDLMVECYNVDEGKRMTSMLTTIIGAACVGQILHYIDGYVEQAYMAGYDMDLPTRRVLAEEERKKEMADG